MVHGLLIAAKIALAGAGPAPAHPEPIDEAAAWEARHDWEAVERAGYHPVALWMLELKWRLQEVLRAAERAPSAPFFWLGADAE